MKEILNNTETEVHHIAELQNVIKTLKEDKLDKFIKEQKVKGDKKAFDATLSSMAGKKKSTRGTSSQDDGES